jgi:hypothetical protein
MIPHRMLRSDICGNGLRDRVTACRKRLRVNWVMQARVHQSEELFPETGVSATEFLDQYPAMRKSLYCSSAFAGPSEAGDGELLAVAGEQEVGMT